MFVQVKAGGNARAGERWQTEIADIVEGALGRFGAQLKTVDVFLGDENSREKRGDADKRCLMEARLAGLPPIAVRSHADTYSAAVGQCADKIRRTLDHRLGRLADKHLGRTTDGDAHAPAAGLEMVQ